MSEPVAFDPAGLDNLHDSILGVVQPPEETESPSDRRHPAKVTIDRLADHLGKWSDRFTARELAAAELLSHALDEIARGSR